MPSSHCKAYPLKHVAHLFGDCESSNYKAMKKYLANRQLSHNSFIISNYALSPLQLLHCFPTVGLIPCYRLKLYRLNLHLKYRYHENMRSIPTHAEHKSA